MRNYNEVLKEVAVDEPVFLTKNGTLQMDKINTVPNLAWICYTCINIITGGEIPLNASFKMKSKIERYRAKLKVLN